MRSLVCISLVVGLLGSMTHAQPVEIQTDWSGGPDVFGPVPQWGDQFLAATDAAWRSIPGQLALSSTPLSQPIETVIAPDAGHPKACATGDIDGDGDADVITCEPTHYPDGEGWIYWWERQPNGDWTQHVVDNAFYGAYRVNVADVDVDGDLDVLSAAYYGELVPPPPNGMAIDGRYAWFENLNGDGSTWTQHVVGNRFWGARYIDAGDLDSDGDTDIVGAAELTDGVYEQDGDITWFENLDGAGLQWAQHDLETERNSAEAHVADIDGDGDMDVISGEQGRIGWWENRNGDGSLWIKRYVTTAFGDSGMRLDTGDIDNDGDLDVFGASYHNSEIVWWENTAGNGSVWFGRLVATGTYTNVIELRDIDGDGDLDVGISLGLTAGAAYWLENTSGDGLTWAAWLITTNIDGINWLTLGDVSDDGRLDAVICHEDTWSPEYVNQVAWHDLTAFNGQGELLSSVLDGDAGRTWGQITWDVTTPVDSGFTVQVRASDDPYNLGSFTAVEASGDDLANLIDANAPYLQYRLLLSSNDADASPIVREINVERHVLGDLDGDGCVDLSDLAALLADYGCTVDCVADLDGDGNVALSDLAILLSNYGIGCG
jgi:hypothetical protein